MLLYIQTTATNGLIEELNSATTNMMSGLMGENCHTFQLCRRFLANTGSRHNFLFHVTV